MLWKLRTALREITVTGADYHGRLADGRLRDLMVEFPAVMIHGPRGAGKTTTARRIAGDIISLDQPAQAAAFRADPDGALRRFTEPILLDEWQEVPEVLGAVKRAVDADGRPGRFLLTGSVRAELNNRMWPATGRAVRLRMYGVSERELAGGVDGGEPSFFDKLESGDPDTFRLPADVPDLPGYIDLALRSSFPDIVYRGRDEAARRIWLDSYLEQLLTRDATSLGHARDPARLRPYFEALALNTAGIAADKTIYDAAGVNARTAAAYDQLLASLFVLELVPAWSTNRLRRLVKTAKRYIVDPGLVASGAGLTTRDVLADGDLLGRIIDTFAVSQLRPELALSEDRCRLYHLRIEGGRHEVDLVVERGAGRVLGIEIKAGAAPDKSDARHLEWLRGELGDRFLAGAVIHTGPAVYQLSERIIAIPLCAIWGRA